MDKKQYIQRIQLALDTAVQESRSITDGNVADYIPELANVKTELCSASVMLLDGTLVSSGDKGHSFTVQSVAKLALLIGMLEEYGQDKVFSWINMEPSGSNYSSVAQVERYGNLPVNPMVNAGAICLCSYIPGNSSERQAWLDNWIKRIFGQDLKVDGKVFSSEMATADKNRSIAYLLKSLGGLNISVDATLETYHYLCSYELDTNLAARLSMILANGGRDENMQSVISERTCNTVISIMVTSGLYDESGSYLVRTGLPAKSGVSGLIVAVATGRAGIAVNSPKLNEKGGSVRGHYILESLSEKLHWHFASPWGYFRE